MGKLNELNSIRKDEKQLSKKSMEKSSQKRLKKILGKKLQTSFIFPLSEFENAFGKKLWGHGLEEDELTQEQKENRDKWLTIRKNVLDKGNAQIRACGNEIDLYDINFVGYFVNFSGDKDAKGNC